MRCTNMQALKDYQVNQLKEHIRNNQYFMGEREDHSIDWGDAERDFTLHHFNPICKEMRIEFCSHKCPFRDDCNLGKELIKKDLDLDS